MKALRVLGECLLVACLPFASGVAHAAPGGAKDAIRAVLTRQVSDWNRGDLEAFAKGYKKSPDIVFVGKTVRRGYDGMLASYRKNYGSREAMGVLAFSDEEVHLLDGRFAEVLGKYHLKRTAAGGGDADGFFSLILERTAAGWKIVSDHTTSTLPEEGK